MPSINDLELFELTIGGQDFADDPNRYMIAALERHPWLARSEFGYLLIDYDAMNDIFAMEDRLEFSADHVVAIMGGEGTPWGRFQVSHLVTKSGGDHQRIRSSVSKVFLPRSVNSYQDRISQTISALLDKWVPKGSFDFEEFATNFPVAVIFGLLGANPSLIPEISGALEGMSESLSLNRAVFPKVSKSFDELWAFLTTLIDDRRANGNAGGPDLLDSLIAAETNGQITMDELRDLLVVIVVAGYDTSRSQMTHIVNLLIDRPHLWQRCASERGFCTKVVEEALRHSGVGSTFRAVKDDIEYRGVLIPKGTMLMFPLGIICRFSDKFKDPNEFDPERSNANRNMAFGRGMHMCLGQFLARLQIAEGIHQITRRICNPRRVGELVWRNYPGTWGPRHLLIAFDAADPVVVLQQGQMQ